MIFAALLIFSLSLTGIAGVNASDMGTAQTQADNASAVQKNFKTQVNDTTILNETVKIQNKTDNISKHVTKYLKHVKKHAKHKKIHSNKKATTLTKNAVKHRKDNFIKKSNSTKTHRTVHKSEIANSTLRTKAITKIIVSKSDIFDDITSTNFMAKSKSAKIQKIKPYKIQNTSDTLPINASTVSKLSTVNTTLNDTVNTQNPQAAAGETKTTGTTLSTTEKPMAAGSPTTSKVPASLKKYTKSTKNCQVTDSKIKTLAKKITKGKKTTYQKAVAIFNWVRNNLAYSFYYNTKYGAKGALSKKKGNCVDTAHLLIALERAAGIPARYVHGNAKFKSGKTYGHVWAEVYVNGKWYKADASSNSNSFGTVKSWTSAKIKGRYASLSF